MTNGGTAPRCSSTPRPGAEVATVKTGEGPDAAAFDAEVRPGAGDGPRGGDVTLIDAKTHKAVGSIAVGGDLEAAAVDGAGQAFVNVENKNEIAVIDMAQRKVVARYPLAGCDGRRAWPTTPPTIS